MKASFARWQSSSLPIYWKNDGKDVLFYAPGYLLRYDAADWDGRMGTVGEWGMVVAHARDALRQQIQWHEPFSPVSLHLYLTRECNLRCSYCFSDPEHADPSLMMPSMPAIESAAAWVADNCHEKSRAMTLVCHGGGEPMLAANLPEITGLVQDICNARGVQLYRYLATNGVMSASQAKWVCDTFDLVGLSCDGPPWIQNQQRPLAGGGKSAAFVEQTAHIFHENHQPFQSRVTLTAGSWQKMPEIAQYMASVIHPEGVNVELVYHAGIDSLKESELDAFVDLFFAARTICEQNGIFWRSSAVRPGQVHRQYCHVLQDTLQILPGDAASLCFLDNDADECAKRGTRILNYDPGLQAWQMDTKQVDTARGLVMVDMDACRDCFVSLHCNRSCPDHCPLSGSRQFPDLRCQLNQRMLNTQLDRSAEILRNRCHQENKVMAGMEIVEC